MMSLLVSATCARFGRPIAAIEVAGILMELMRGVFQIMRNSRRVKRDFHTERARELKCQICIIDAYHAISKIEAQSCHIYSMLKF